MNPRHRRWRLAQGYLMSACAFLWRRLMVRTTFIAITGSVGKTTATDCLGAILSAHAPTNWTPGGSNSRESLARNILRTRFRHRFCVIEVGTRAPGALRRAAWMIHPHVAVVLQVLSVHSNTFPTLEDVWAEKVQLLSRLGRRGCAVLNADDPRVLAMRERCRGPVRTFGLAPENYLRATEASSRWPHRLSFRAHCGGESQWVETNLVGEHLLPSALAAIAVAVYCGVPLERVAALFKEIQPVASRMRPMDLGNGITAIRDDFSTTLPAFQKALDWLRAAECGRRIVVVGDVFDTGLTVCPRMREIGRRVATAADMAVFMGKDARISAKAAVEAGLPAHAAPSFRFWPEAAAFLKTELRRGDLLLVRGWDGRHLERVVLSQLGNVACRRERCTKHNPCDTCSELGLVQLKS